jgi:uncharacterized protein (DUF4415 family)
MRYDMNERDMKSKRTESGSRGRLKSKSRRSATGATSAARADDRIDTSDIPPLTDDFFRNAVRNPFYRPIKRSTTVRIDADVLAWLKSQGPGYQTRINELLRSAMEMATGANRSR